LLSDGGIDMRTVYRKHTGFVAGFIVALALLFMGFSLGIMAPIGMLLACAVFVNCFITSPIRQLPDFLFGLMAAIIGFFVFVVL